jgi:hypothetical protein
MSALDLLANRLVSILQMRDFEWFFRRTYPANSHLLCNHAKLTHSTPIGLLAHCLRDRIPIHGLFRRRQVVSKKVLTGIMIAALAILATACSDATQSNMNSAANTNSSPANTAAVTAPDNSEVTTTTDNNGVKTETRTFKSHPRVSKVVVTTRGGTRTAKVYSANGEEKDVGTSDPDVLQATGDAIADAAGWVKDKSLTVADKTKEGAKTVADKTVDASKTVADKTVDASKTVYNKSKPVVKKVGDKSVDIGTTVVDKTKAGAKKTGSAIKKVIVP